MKKQSLLAMILLVISVTLTIVSFLVLPETVITQFSLGSSGETTMPKLLAIALPFALGVGAAVSSFIVRDDKSVKKCFFISGVGVVVFVIMLYVNCFMK